MFKLFVFFFIMVAAEKLITFDQQIKIIGHIKSSKIIAICGQARVGKSTFINNFFEKKIAKTSNEQETCTKDIDFYTDTISSYSMVTRNYDNKNTITFLDVEGDDLGDLTKNLKMARFTASISQVFIYYARDKISVHSLNTIQYIKKYSGAITILFVRTQLKHKKNDMFDYTFTFSDSYEFLKSYESTEFKKIINDVPIRDSEIIMQTLRENINLQVPKIYSVIELDKNCKDFLRNCLEKNICEPCGIIEYDTQIKNHYITFQRVMTENKKKADCIKALQKCEDENICNFCGDSNYDAQIKETRRYNKEQDRQFFTSIIGALAPFAAGALFLSDYRFKENIIRNEVNFCWKWKFSNSYACGEITGTCYENYEFKDYIKFLGVYLLK